MRFERQTGDPALQGRKCLSFWEAFLSVCSVGKKLSHGEH